MCVCVCVCVCVQVINARGELTDSPLGEVVAAGLEELFRGAVVPALARTGAHRFEPLRLFVVGLGVWGSGFGV